MPYRAGAAGAALDAAAGHGAVTLMSKTVVQSLLGAWFDRAWPVLFPAALAVLALAAAVAAHHLLWRFLRRLASRGEATLAARLEQRCWAAASVAFPALFLELTLPALELPPRLDSFVGHVVDVVGTGALAWLSVKVLFAFSDLLVIRAQRHPGDRFRARALATQVEVFRRVAAVVIGIVAAGLLLMTFQRVRAVGAGILASAGVAGLVAGMAARPTLANLLAGLQIAITQPIRLEDVVIVDNQWGWVEEITTTYVVVRIWNLQRLVVPIAYFIEHSFQNWTRRTTDLIGTIHIYADYTIPVQELRRELKRLAEANPKWDRKVCVLQVTHATERAVELRALVSAADSSTLWDLRCEVREQLIDYLQRNHPQCLPRTRAELDQSVPDGAALAPESRGADASKRG